MVAIGSVSSLVDAGTMIGIVLAEAIVLYFVYGAAESAFSERVINQLKKS
ncbi:MAG: DUF7512 family protein [archaeon]